jgi:rubrerythrin
MKMELTGKAIVFDSEENAQLWFKTIQEVETQKICEAKEREFERFKMLNLKVDNDGHLKKKSIIMVCCNCGARTKVDNTGWRQCPRCNQSRNNFLMK